MRSLAVACVSVALLAGCGQAELTIEQEGDIAEARYNFANLVLDGSGYAESLNSVDPLIALYREKPDAEYDGIALDDVLRDEASRLDEYQPDMAAELDRAVN